ncbi:hypothetical protein H6G89_07720 [Oscillatoria sp. FACHB-1407]|uniref:hypothetical protein n=1 Tax=Oscillatoria sp. FACHB-1407 TaxID=2692847 RepID=UPI00168A164E|nr:hypothetical protein [Oscillatoria sp. FACHB-1407]MBD2460930.1 hypothetical protein [Oscillatoria sp. FACHB-1407]
MNVPLIFSLFTATCIAIPLVGLSSLLPTPGLTVLAHETEISGNIGGTMHIEPNDNPRAGTPALTWFALRTRNGQNVPLSACRCELAVYTQPRRAGQSPIQRPTLRAVSQEGYEGIPGATINFPRAGSYELILRGQPVRNGAFPPFELRFSVLVAR